MVIFERVATDCVKFTLDTYKLLLIPGFFKFDVRYGPAYHTIGDQGINIAPISSVKDTILMPV